MTNITDWQDITIAGANVKWGMGGGAITTGIGAFTSNELLVFVGIATTILGFIVNCIFMYRRDKRATKEHQIQLQLLEKELHTNENKCKDSPSN